MSARTPEQKAKHRERNARWYTKHSGEKMDRQKNWNRDNIAQFLFIHVCYSAKRKGRECSITRELIEELLKPMRCSVTSHELLLTWNGIGRNNPWAPSIDRIDSSRGYTPDNVRVVSWIYNRCKGEWTDEVVAQFRGEGP